MLCNIQGIAWGAVGRYASADGSSMVAKITAYLCPSTDGSTVLTSWWPAVAKLQAASMPVA